MFEFQIIQQGTQMSSAIISTAVAVPGFFPTGVWGRHSKESPPDGPCGGHHPDHHQSRRCHFGGESPFFPQGHSDLLRAVLRHHLGRDSGETCPVAGGSPFRLNASFTQGETT